MSGEYEAGLMPGNCPETRATHFARSSTVVLVLMAALPAGLGLLQQIIFSASTRAPAISSENAAATALTLGNQPLHSALEDGGKVTLGARGGVLALCSGALGAKPVARLNCATLSSTIQR